MGIEARDDFPTPITRCHLIPNSKSTKTRVIAGLRLVYLSSRLFILQAKTRRETYLKSAPVLAFAYCNKANDLLLFLSHVRLYLGIIINANNHVDRSL